MGAASYPQIIVEAALIDSEFGGVGLKCWRAVKGVRLIIWLAIPRRTTNAAGCRNRSYRHHSERPGGDMCLLRQVVRGQNALGAHRRRQGPGSPDSPGWWRAPQRSPSGQ